MHPLTDDATVEYSFEKDASPAGQSGCLIGPGQRHPGCPVGSPLLRTETRDSEGENLTLAFLAFAFWVFLFPLDYPSFYLDARESDRIDESG
jgi:hypothetical protein